MSLHDSNSQHTSSNDLRDNETRQQNDSLHGDSIDSRAKKISLQEQMQIRRSALTQTGHHASTSEEIRYNEDASSTDPIYYEESPFQSSKKPESIWRRRWRRFRSIKRGYYSFLVLAVLYLVSFMLPLIMNNRALMVTYNGETYFPAVADLFDFLPGISSFYSAEQFGQTGELGEVKFRSLAKQYEEEGEGNSVTMPFYPWNPYETDFELTHPAPPSGKHLLGTDDSGRDVLVRLAYGFTVSISFALLLAVIYYIIGTALGAIMGYFGSKIDLIGQRVVEIWETIPFLYTVIIISSILKPSFMLLVGVLAIFQWIGISYFIRGEFLREKTKDYAAAAISLGASTPSIIFRHLLPNSLTPIITFFPFALVGGISVLVSLDFLGFGLQPPTPSWGQMIDRGLQNLEAIWLVIAPITALFFTLMLVTFIGEGVREALDPKVFSRLR